MTMGPEPRIRILEMSFRRGIYWAFFLSVFITKFTTYCLIEKQIDASTLRCRVDLNRDISISRIGPSDVPIVCRFNTQKIQPNGQWRMESKRSGISRRLGFNDLIRYGFG